MKSYIDYTDGYSYSCPINTPLLCDFALLSVRCEVCFPAVWSWAELGACFTNKTQWKDLNSCVCSLGKLPSYSVRDLEWAFWKMRDDIDQKTSQLELSESYLLITWRWPYYYLEMILQLNTNALLMQTRPEKPSSWAQPKWLIHW